MFRRMTPKMFLTTLGTRLLCRRNVYFESYLQYFIWFYLWLILYECSVQIDLFILFQAIFSFSLFLCKVFSEIYFLTKHILLHKFLLLLLKIYIWSQFWCIYFIFIYFSYFEFKYFIFIRMSTDFEQHQGIRPLDGAVSRRICTGQVIISLAGACRELMDNALDAGATNIGMILLATNMKLSFF